ncbi:hypothetical protein CEQ90_01395 [Lewinellaceae bacterium SD302]|nr:hypothetical protein CEQ90_01395 [Lewinellaceae bacterium SD302]
MAQSSKKKLSPPTLAALLYLCALFLPRMSPKPTISFRIIFLLFAGSMAMFTSKVAAQTAPESRPDTSGTEIINIDFSEQLRVLRGRNRRVVQKLIGQVELSQDSIYMYCDSADLVEEVQLYAYNNVIIQQGDSIAAFAEYLDYNAETQLADLRRNVVLQNGDRELYTDALRYDLAEKLATYTTGGRLTDGKTQLFSTRGYYYAAADRIYFRDSVVVIGEQFELRADTLMYDSPSETVYFLGPTVIRTDTAEIYCEDGFYNVTTNQAVFRQNAQYRSGSQIAAADSISYFGQRQEYILEGQAYVRDGDSQFARADKITYRKDLETYDLKGNALLRDSARTVRGEAVTYDKLNDAYQISGGRPEVIDGTMILTADNLDFDNASGFGFATGQVVWQDTSSNLEIRAARAQYNQETGYLKASGGRGNRALLITVLDGDSLYLSADTLFSQEVVDSLIVGSSSVGSGDSTVVDSSLVESGVVGSSDSLIVNSMDSTLVDTITRPKDHQTTGLQDQQTTKTRKISAYRDVRVYKSDMQALCDSLSFNTTDSILTLYEDPILWQDTSQLLADTVDIYLKNDALDKVHLKRRALVVTSPDLIFFNQVKGKNIFAYFDSTELRRTDVKGNAEVIYYAQDAEGAYIGVNKTACSAMSLDFLSGGIRFIRFITAPSGRLDPLNGINGNNQPTLDGFRWESDARPASLDDLFGPSKRARAVVPLEEATEEEYVVPDTGG